jgi:hypothetical protein
VTLFYKTNISEHFVDLIIIRYALDSGKQFNEEDAKTARHVAKFNGGDTTEGPL